MTNTELKLLKSFPGSFINCDGEFISERHTCAGFDLADCKCSKEIKCKVLEWCSGAAFKSGPMLQKERMMNFTSLFLMKSMTFSTLNFQKKIWN